MPEPIFRRGDTWAAGVTSRTAGTPDAVFRAMQFNLVVSTNEVAVRLWQHHGFDIVGTIPDGFDHPDLGMVDAYVMYRTL